MASTTQIRKLFTLGSGRHKHVVNAGSVEKPKDGNPKGCYVLLTVNGDANLADKGV